MDFPDEIYVWDESSDTIYKALRSDNLNFPYYFSTLRDESDSRILFKSKEHKNVIYCLNETYECQIYQETFSECLNYREQILHERMENLMAQISSPPRFEE